jgi:hypothetical protein
LPHKVTTKAISGADAEVLKEYEHYKKYAGEENALSIEKFLEYYNRPDIKVKRRYL